MESLRRRLQENLASRLQKNPRYSLRAFARSLGVDHATLSQILRGKRTLSPMAMRRLARRAGLRDDEIERMVRDAPRERADKADAARVLTDPLHRMVLETTSLPHFRADARWIAKVLGASVDAVNVAITRLSRLDLLEMSGRRWIDRSRGNLARAVAERLSKTTPVPSSSIPEVTMGKPVMQFQILAKDPDAAARFYGALFGWAVNADNALGYRRLDTNAGRGIAGGIWPAPEGARAGVQLFVEVEDVARMVERASSLGATVAVPPQKLPDGDEMAIIVDPEGLALGLFRPRASVRAP